MTSYLDVGTQWLEHVEHCGTVSPVGPGKIVFQGSHRYRLNIAIWVCSVIGIPPTNR